MNRVEIKLYIERKALLVSAGNGFYNFMLNNPRLEQAKEILAYSAWQFLNEEISQADFDQEILNWLSTVYIETELDFWKRRNAYGTNSPLRRASEFEDFVWSTAYGEIDFINERCRKWLGQDWVSTDEFSANFLDEEDFQQQTEEAEQSLHKRKRKVYTKKMRETDERERWEETQPRYKNLME